MAEFTKEQMADAIREKLRVIKQNPNTARYGNVQDSDGMNIAIYEIALAVLTAEPEEYIFDHPHGKLFRSISDKSNAGMPGVFPVYRLPLLEGLK